MGDKIATVATAKGASAEEEESASPARTESTLRRFGLPELPEHSCAILGASPAPAQNEQGPACQPSAHNDDGQVGDAATSTLGNVSSNTAASPRRSRVAS